jgi:hypothetical protein
MRKLHDLSDVLRAVAVATKLAVEQIDEVETEVVSVADHIRATHDQNNRRQ